MRLLTRKAVCELVGLSRTQLGRIEDFPRSLKLGDYENSRVVYVESEVHDWIAKRIAERDKAH